MIIMILSCIIVMGEFSLSHSPSIHLYTDNTNELYTYVLRRFFNCSELVELGDVHFSNSMACSNWIVHDLPDVKPY